MLNMELTAFQPHLLRMGRRRVSIKTDELPTTAKYTTQDLGHIKIYQNDMPNWNWLQIRTKCELHGLTRNVSSG
jgi:hypothetical protein